jgi:hypothetical protein
MKKMMTLAVMMALAAMMLAAAPALAQDDGGRGQDKVTICHVPPGNPGNAHLITIGFPAVAHHLANHPGDFIIDGGTQCPPEDGPGPGPGPGPDDGRDGRDRDRDNVADVVPVVEINQETEQECESGDVDQSFDVSQTGDNSNQTVGLQGTANTGCAQNVTNVVDAGPFVGDFDNNDGFFNDGFVICDFDNDGVRDGDNDECEDFNNNDGFLVCDSDGDGINDSRFDDCVVIFPDFNDGGFFDDGDRDQFFVNGNNDGDIEIEDSGASITMSPTNTTNSHQEVNQAAAASATWPWWSM